MSNQYTQPSLIDTDLFNKSMRPLCNGGLHRSHHLAQIEKALA